MWSAWTTGRQVKAGNMPFDVVIAAPTQCAWSARWVRSWARAA